MITDCKEYILLLCKKDDGKMPHPPHGCHHLLAVWDWDNGIYTPIVYFHAALSDDITIKTAKRIAEDDGKPLKVLEVKDECFYNPDYETYEAIHSDGYIQPLRDSYEAEKMSR